MATMKWREFIRMLEDDGWYWVSTRGSHQKYKHPVKSGFVIVASHGLNTDISPGLLNQMKKDAGWK